MAKTTKTHKPMTARSKGSIALVVLLALVVFVSCLAVGGMKLDSEGVKILLPWVPVSAENWPDSLPLSRALGGGYYMEYTAVAGEGADQAAEMKKAASIMQERMVMRGVTDAKVTVKDASTLRLELPILDEETMNAVIDLAVAPAKFEFSFGGEVFMTNEHIKEAGIGYADQTGTSYAVALTTTEEGKQLLADATAAHIGEEMTLTRDGVTLISAGVNEAFTTGQISVPLGLEYVETVEVAIQMSAGSYDLTLTFTQGAELENAGKGVLTAVLIAVAVVLVAALVYAVVTGKLTGIAAMLMAWCAIMLEFFFYATLVLATINVAVLIALLIGVALALYAALVRVQAISAQIAAGNAPKSAVKVGLRTVAKKVWLVHAAALALSLVLMIFSFSQIIGYALCAAVVASALVTPVMRAFLACFAAITSKPALFGKAQ
ncbi:MAG: hypothetical protein E7329_12080 [Clostridiales bacterium]|nr:hypothetical protein [Clostridiales bacterium]